GFGAVRAGSHPAEGGCQYHGVQRRDGEVERLSGSKGFERKTGQVPRRMSDNREHLERLLTEAADGPMNGDEIRRYGQLARLLAGWRTLDADVNWAGLSGRISSRIRQDVEALASARVDHLIDPSLAADGDEA